MKLWTFRTGASKNWAQMSKSGLSQDAYTVDWIDALPGTETLSSAVTTAISTVGATVTSNWVSSTTISGTTTVVSLKTGGVGGTSAALDADRAELKTQVTLTSGKVFEYLVFIYVRNKTYSPIPT